MMDNAAVSLTPIEKNRVRSRAWAKAHPERVREFSRAWRKANPKYYKTWKKANYEKYQETYRIWVKNNHQKRKNRHLIRSYGISLIQYKQLLKKQGGHCVVCPTKVELGVDHNHKTGKVRGILCSPHNWLLGNLEKNQKVVYKLFRYLEESEKWRKQ